MEGGLSMVRFILLMAGIALLLTIFLFPTSHQGAVLDMYTGKEIATPRVVKLSPAFGRGSVNELYSLVLSPSLSEYAMNVPSSHQIALLTKNARPDRHGTIHLDWSFAWFYWFLIVLLPSAIISSIVLSMQRHKAQQITKAKK
jgi:hypothetical protein